MCVQARTAVGTRAPPLAGDVSWQHLAHSLAQLSAPKPSEPTRTAALDTYIVDDNGIDKQPMITPTATLGSPQDGTPRDRSTRACPAVSRTMPWWHQVYSNQAPHKFKLLAKTSTSNKHARTQLQHARTRDAQQQPTAHSPSTSSLADMYLAWKQAACLSLQLGWDCCCCWCV